MNEPITKIAITCFISIALLISLVWQLTVQFTHYDAMYRSQLNRHSNYLIAHRLRITSEELTKMARLYVLTGDQHYKEIYEDIVKFREGGKILSSSQNERQLYWGRLLKIIPKREIGNGENADSENYEYFNDSDLDPEGKHLLLRSLELSAQLTIVERKAMDVVSKTMDYGQLVTDIPQEQYNGSIYPLVGPEYLEAKQAVMHPINNFNELLNTKTLTDIIYCKKKVEETNKWVGILATLNLISLLTTVIFVYRLYRSKKEPQLD
ncbi:hypothetical protein BCT46_14880 [Vibrio sp. 10N.261.46.E8]|uniref:hypothetical protein n=2 Tax=Vibrio TaxID=662 RepID=UPI0009762D2E|nr:hypothetical protein BH584_04700 [Vibrio sp. 10N.261.45.E1]PMJ34570.1 hypothetical protein BCU27_03835 [Vibrio sp. 10N.286.45.B6]PML88098.1 hypothetical protein BCT66_10905 [Vibrio sp. 10N.261.49.E11]PMM67426.1 hypothetical protein BCT48_15380 [Vibrio sp. 10N.261.46.F12]PMM81691.1 hypothetical protein BCT46_14880 [Vibrio sp. 10N.261.46.E8]PMN77941.1 hypothetical protein BCT22_20445 [Vibrio sp. 10N.261.45.A1]PMN91919.1 hypothetical protein BCT25_00830 [Vibrio sp. 10N.261.45.A6]